MGGRHFYLAKELARQGYKVYLIAASYHHLLRRHRNLQERFNFEETSGFTFISIKVPSYEHAHSKQRAINWFLFAWHLRKLRSMIPDSPDAVLCSSPSPFSFLTAKRLARDFSARLIFEVRDIWPMTLIEVGGLSQTHPLIYLMKKIEYMAYSDSDRVISNLQYAVKHMTNRGMNRNKFTWIPNGFSLDEVQRNTPLDDTALNKIPDDKFIVGYTGTLGVANALDTLIESAEKLKDHKDIAFVIVGGGREKSRLEKMVKDRALANVTFIEPIQKVQIQAMLDKFSVCYIGFTKDPLFRFGVSPNKLFDYLYSAKPIIYAIDSGEYHPVEDAGAGYEIEPHNPEVLAQTIMRLYKTSREERALMGERGRREALEHYEYQKLARKLAEVLFDGKAHND